MKRLATWNVNGLRACVDKGFTKWIEKNSYDIICIQETKFQHSKFEDFLSQNIRVKNYFQYFSSSIKPGYSGVGIFTKNKPIKVLEGINKKKFDNEGRCLTIEFEKFYLTNAYFPNGRRDHSRVSFKLEFCHDLHHFLNKLRKKKHVILCGDLNTAHTEIDLKNPKTNLNSTGFLPIERKWMDDFISDQYVDLFRYKYPKKENEYTWWTYRNDCREKNIGWRLDYFLSDSELAKKVKSVKHLKNVLGSDHCPVELNIDL